MSLSSRFAQPLPAPPSKLRLNRKPASNPAERHSKRPSSVETRKESQNPGAPWINDAVLSTCCWSQMRARSALPKRTGFGPRASPPTRPTNHHSDHAMVDIGSLMQLWTGEAGFGNHPEASEELVFDDEKEDRTEKAMLWLYRYTMTDIISKAEPKAKKTVSWACLLCDKKPYSRRSCLTIHHKEKHIKGNTFSNHSNVLSAAAKAAPSRRSTAQHIGATTWKESTTPCTRHRSTQGVSPSLTPLPPRETSLPTQDDPYQAEARSRRYQGLHTRSFGLRHIRYQSEEESPRRQGEGGQVSWWDISAETID
ncbi:hypothetical protein GGR55DRAFT_696169 [Xylaria sp. FL0064]|nr:hypothetical protein GGR55DRAFT_696169 [Xylaria sp. FL0064]